MQSRCHSPVFLPFRFTKLLVSKRPVGYNSCPLTFVSVEQDMKGNGNVKSLRADNTTYSSQVMDGL